MRFILILICVFNVCFILPARAQLVGERPLNWVPPPPVTVPNHREQWREVVIGLSDYAKERKQDFIILVEGASELVAKGDREIEWEEIQDPSGMFFEKRLPEGSVFRSYLNVIDGLVIPNLYCGDNSFNKPLEQALSDWQLREEAILRAKARGIRLPRVEQDYGPFSSDPEIERKRGLKIKRKSETQERLRRLLLAIKTMQDYEKIILAYDACPTKNAVRKAFKDGERDNILESATVASSLENLTIPSGSPWGENAQFISNIGMAKNWLPPVNNTQFHSKTDWLTAVGHNNYDVVTIDLNYGRGGISAANVNALKYKTMGSKRLVLARLPISKAFDTAWYWKQDWRVNNPAFLFAPNALENGSFIVDVGNPQWRELLGKTIEGIINIGFDGVILTEVDSYLWFEELMPLRVSYY